MMKYSLVSILLVVASPGLLAQPLIHLPSVPAPEPSSASLLVIGIVALGLARRRAAK